MTCSLEWFQENQSPFILHKIPPSCSLFIVRSTLCKRARMCVRLVIIIKNYWKYSHVEDSNLLLRQRPTYEQQDSTILQNGWKITRARAPITVMTTLERNMRMWCWVGYCVIYLRILLLLIRLNVEAEQWLTLRCTTFTSLIWALVSLWSLRAH